MESPYAGDFWSTYTTTFIELNNNPYQLLKSIYPVLAALYHMKQIPPAIIADTTINGNAYTFGGTISIDNMNTMM